MLRKIENNQVKRFDDRGLNLQDFPLSKWLKGFLPIRDTLCIARLHFA